MRTYAVKGEIVVINDCSGRGADNDLSVDVTAKFFYKPLAPTNFSRKSQPVVMALAGVTTTGNYNLRDVPTNQELDHIEVEIEEQMQDHMPDGWWYLSKRSNEWKPQKC